jgi:hypothetical protein
MNADGVFDVVPSLELGFAGCHSRAAFVEQTPMSLRDFGVIDPFPQV